MGKKKLKPVKPWSGNKPQQNGLNPSAIFNDEAIRIFSGRRAGKSFQAQLINEKYGYQRQGELDNEEFIGNRPKPTTEPVPPLTREEEDRIKRMIEKEFGVKPSPLERTRAALARWNYIRKL